MLHALCTYCTSWECCTYPGNTAVDILVAKESYFRYASLQDEADKQKRLDLLKDRVRNAAFDSDQILWLYDNEAGMLDGYQLIYGKVGANSSEIEKRFYSFHERTLSSICVFRKATVKMLSRLLTYDEPLRTLLDKTSFDESLFNLLNVETMPGFKFLQTHFNERLTSLVAHFKSCSDSFA